MALASRVIRIGETRLLSDPQVPEASPVATSVSGKLPALIGHGLNVAALDTGGDQPGHSPEHAALPPAA